MLGKIVSESRAKLGRNRFRGLPAVFVGAAFIIGACGVATAVARAATMLPDFVRESRELWLAIKGERHRLPP